MDRIVITSCREPSPPGLCPFYLRIPRSGESALDPSPSSVREVNQLNPNPDQYSRSRPGALGSITVPFDDDLPGRRGFGGHPPSRAEPKVVDEESLKLLRGLQTRQAVPPVAYVTTCAGAKNERIAPPSRVSPKTAPANDSLRSFYPLQHCGRLPVALATFLPALSPFWGSPRSLTEGQQNFP